MYPYYTYDSCYIFLSLYLRITPWLTAIHVSSGKYDASNVKTGFLSTLERFGPPRDILVEEPDVSNPGMYATQVQIEVELVGGIRLSNFKCTIIIASAILESLILETITYPCIHDCSVTKHLDP